MFKPSSDLLFLSYATIAESGIVTIPIHEGE